MFIVTHAQNRRRELVSTLAELLNEKPRYCYAPSFAFAFSQYTVDRDAVIHPSENAEQQAVIDLAALLNRRGFECEVSDIAADAPESEGHYTVCVERGKISEETLSKLRRIVRGKAGLLRQALGESSLEILTEAQNCIFPWFPADSDETSRNAYAVFIEKLIAFAEQRTRVTAEDKPCDNPKYAFRCFLLRLGFIGVEYRKERAVLLRNLQGCSAFRSGRPNQTETEEQI